MGTDMYPSKAAITQIEAMAQYKNACVVSVSFMKFGVVAKQYPSHRHRHHLHRYRVLFS